MSEEYSYHQANWSEEQLRLYAKMRREYQEKVPWWKLWRTNKYEKESTYRIQKVIHDAESHIRIQDRTPIFKTIKKVLERKKIQLRTVFTSPMPSAKNLEHIARDAIAEAAEAKEVTREGRAAIVEAENIVREANKKNKKDKEPLSWLQNDTPVLARPRKQVNIERQQLFEYLQAQFELRQHYHPRVKQQQHGHYSYLKLTWTNTKHLPSQIIRYSSI